MACRCSRVAAHHAWKIQVSFGKNPDRKILEDCVWKLPLPSNSFQHLHSYQVHQFSMLYLLRQYLLNRLTLTCCLPNPDSFTLLFLFGLNSGEWLFPTPIICCRSHRFNQLWFMDGSSFCTSGHINSGEFKSTTAGAWICYAIDMKKI